MSIARVVNIYIVSINNQGSQTTQTNNTYRTPTNTQNHHTRIYYTLIMLFALYIV